MFPTKFQHYVRAFIVKNRKSDPSATRKQPQPCKPPTALQRWRGILQSTLVMDGEGYIWQMDILWETNIAAWKMKRLIYL